MKLLLEPSFTKNPLDRMEHIRGEIEHFFATITPSQTAFILICDDKLIVHENETDFLFSYEELILMGGSNDKLIFLGRHNLKYYFTKTIEAATGSQYKSIDLRSFAIANLNAEGDMGILAQAFSVLKWHETHQFCSTCGAKNVLMQAGWRQDCTGCGKQHFPRIDPVVIMLVTHGEYCLLGAGRNFQQQRYSCLAGFMEPGETIENEARRELFEEAGVVGLDVRYILSQPWPFPFSLMIGVHMYADNRTLDIDYNELADARWVHKSDIIAVLKGADNRGFSLPPPIAIARSLLEYWVDKTAD